MTQDEAALALGCSDRTIRRLFQRFVPGDIDALRHRSTGKPGHHRYPLDLKEEIVMLAREKYPDAGPSLLASLLKERHQHKISPECARLWLNEAGITLISESKPRHRRMRERKAAYGTMLQFDTCTHDFFGSGEQQRLILGVDDATSVTDGWMYNTDSTATNMDFIKRYCQAHGCPPLILVDRAGHFKVNKGESEEKILNPFDKSETQIQRAVKECGGVLIFAGSPQSKGRVERKHQTLQNQLTKLFRYDNINDIKSANEYLQNSYLPKHNKEYTVKPVVGFDAHLNVSHLDLAAIFSIQRLRVVRLDYTFSIDGRVFQIGRENNLSGLAKKRILVEERLDGTIRARHVERYLTICDTGRTYRR
jgi:transposase